MVPIITKEAAKTRLTRILTVLAMVFTFSSAEAIDASNRYRSPRNPERSIRRSTELIVLHTTEAPARSSLNKLSERGEAHFCVTEDGSVYRIVDRDREAFHAGRSMWTGKEDVDKYSIGIECVGYHDKPMPVVQLRAIRDLVAELKSMYKLTDDKVVAHSHVAYGAPNKWHPKKHRGRKQCGMLFAMPSVRRILELKSRPASDPDVRAKRLVVGDPYLERVLYGRTDTMKRDYASVVASDIKKTKTSGGLFSWFRSSEPSPPPSPQPTPTPTPTPTKAIAKAPAVKQVTPTQAKPRASFKTPPSSIAELKSRGYVQLGTIAKGTGASKVAGAKWNDADTFYTIRNKVIPGNTLNASKVEVGMGVWRKK